ncbi:hypothetical protein VPH35_126636 [Triticum aestivum]
MNHFATAVSIFCYYQCLSNFATSIFCFSCLFCYNHILILLELKSFFATSTHGGVAQRQQWLFFATTVSDFCYYRRCHLLPPEFSLFPVFLEASGVFATILCFCWNHPKNLLPTSFDFAGTGIFCFGVGGEGGWCFGSPAAVRLRAPATSRGSGGPSESSAGQRAGSRERRWRLLFSPLFSRGGG